jgi:hypothetical protein
LIIDLGNKGTVGMSTKDEVLEKVDPDRRGFVRKVIVGTAFAAPVISSFSMDGLSIKVGRSAFAGNVTNSY